MKMIFGTGLLFAATLGTLPGGAQSHGGNSTAVSITAANSAGGVAVSPELMGYTVHEAWVQSGRNEEKFFDMVKQLAEVSARKRDVTLPDTEAAGRKMGMLIKASARRDPDQLLYAVVDAAVRQTTSVQHAASAK